ncbi:phosphoenolpyruvate-utilizing N-terminal domain-containing protein, partial [Burkholderia multivorans]|uniref:phosphoenolpyruvate-utilizing N-terminal domain-containing protein n=1 Tax=Burkholderia multivorans TaxID=87883 RepID=UPI0023AA1C8D
MRNAQCCAACSQRTRAEFIIAIRGHKRIAAVCRGFSCTEEVRVSFTLHGIPVSRGIAIGRAYLIAPAALDVAHYLIEANRIDAEVERFRTALDAVHRELEALRADLTDDT